MGLLDTIKSIPGTVKRKVKEHDVKKKKAATALRAKRTKYAPLIQKIAREYGASVDLLNTSAYVTKTVKGQERGVHIPYIGDGEAIRARMDKAFVGSSTVSKIKAAVKTGKQIHKALKDSGVRGGSMWGNPRDMFK